MPSYEKRGDLWSVRFRVEGKQQRLSGFKTKKAATEAYIKSAQETKPAEPDGILFSELARKYLEKKKLEVKESTFYDIEKMIEKQILPAFGNKVASQIKKADIMDWQTERAGYSKKYREKMRVILYGICKFGDLYLDIDNIVAKTESIKSAKKKDKVDFWTEDEFKQFISIVDDPMYHALFGLLYLSGCRKGEALALTRNDFTDDSVSITRKVIGQPYAITTPKNESSDRVVLIPKKIIKECLALPEAKEDHFLFGGDKPIAENTLTRAFDRYIIMSGVKKIRIHDLRHSCASLLISHGASIVAVAHHLGHATVTQTLDTYSHMMPQDASNIMATLEGVM